MVPTLWRTVMRSVTLQLEASPGHHTFETPSLLARLPDELILYVADFLDAKDVACLSLCDRNFQTKLDCSWSLLRTSESCQQQRAGFLSQLARDHPRLFFCHACCLLHSTSHVLPASYSTLRQYSMHMRCTTRPKLSDTPALAFAVHERNTVYRLSFQHVQLAMDRSRRGAGHGLSLEALSVKEIHVAEDNSAKITTLLSIEALCPSNELYLRVQTWTLLNPKDLAGLVDAKHISLCSHVNHYVSADLMSAVIRCKLYHSDEKPSCPTCFLVLKCRRCAMELQITLKEFEQGQDIALVITKWLNLGQGKHVSDPKWQRHLVQPDALRSALHPLVEADWGSGTRYECERASKKSHVDVTAEHASILRRKLVWNARLQKKWSTQEDDRGLVQRSLWIVPTRFPLFDMEWFFVECVAGMLGMCVSLLVLWASLYIIIYT